MKKQHFNHEKLILYQQLLKYVSFANLICYGLKGSHRFPRDQLYRASQSIPFNIAEGNGKSSIADRKRFFEIVRASALECAAIQDVMEISGAIDEVRNDKGKEILSEIVAMLTVLSKKEILHY